MTRAFQSIFFLLIICFTPILSADSLYVSGSSGYTIGYLSNGDVSRSAGIFTTIGTSGYHYLTIGYDKLIKDNPSWDYTQDFYTANLNINLYPYVLNLNYSRLEGKYYWPAPDDWEQYGYTDYSYKDKISVYAVDLSYIINYYHSASVGAVFQKGKGNKDYQQYQISAGFVHFLPYTTYISWKATYTQVDDGRKFFSLGASASTLFFDRFRTSIFGFTGNRAYYFDSAFLTFYNQDDTQNWAAGGSLDCYITPNLVVYGSYGHTKFVSYETNYISFGAKFGNWF